jgi:hypothetical protein
MTREEAVKIWLAFGSHRMDAFNRRALPAHIVDAAMIKNAEDVIDGLIALNLLKVEQPSPQDTTEPSNG